MIYLDNSATTKPCPEAVAAVTRALTEDWANPSALYDFGIEAARNLRTARHAVAAAMSAEPDRVFFTSGGTEADNWAIFGTVKRLGKRGKHIITTAIEHHAILNCMAQLEAQGYEVTYLQPDSEGRVTLDSLKSALRPDTILVSIMMVNNETGAVNDIASLSKLTHTRSQAVFHTDAVQGFLKVPFRATSLGADIITVSSHKICGPKGCGAVYVDKNLHLPPFLYGGGQEKNMRSGTENVPMILGFGAACQEAAKNLPEKLQYMNGLKNRCLELISEQVPQAVLLGSHQAPHIISLAVPGVRSQGLIGVLQEKEIYVSAGSACARGHRSHVMEAMNIAPELIDGSIRVSLCYDTTLEQIEAFAVGLREAVDQLT